MSERRKLTVENLECRRVLAASFGWDGPGLGSSELTYHIANSPNSLNQNAVNAAIETALKAWSDVADIKFTPTLRSGQTDSLDFSFRPLDGSGGTLAQAYFPDDVNPARIAGDVQFDSSETWEVGNGLGNAAFDLVAVAVHEIGHALGLDHTGSAGSVLLPSISPSSRFVSLSAHDIDAIQQLYAPAETKQTPEATAPVAENRVVTEVPRQTESPWSRFHWSFRFGITGFHRGGFGRLTAEASQVHNPAIPTDVNDDQVTTPIDALLVINTINSGVQFSDVKHMCDTNDDGIVSPVDALLVINRLNHQGAERTAPATDTERSNELPVDPSISDNPNVTVEGQGEDDETDDLAPGDEVADFVDTHMGERHEHPIRPILGGLGIGLAGRLGGLRQEAIDSLFANFDSNDDAALTEDEVPTFVWSYLAKQEVDSNANGSITLAEINAAVEAKKLERFDNLDEDGDGRLTDSELSTRQWERIRNADTDGDGGVTFEELKTFQGLSKFAQLDRNSDAQITADEVPARVWKRLSHFDANADEAVTQDELPARPEPPRLIPRVAEIAAKVFRLIQRFR